MSIVLDGVTYYTSGKSYDHAPSKIGSLRRTATGHWDRLETGVFGNRYRIVLDCVPADIQNLRKSFSKTLDNNLLDFRDEEGMRWDPSAGMDEPNHAYGTGVYFPHMGNPQPMTSGIGWSPYNRFLVEIQLEVNASKPFSDYYIWEAITDESDVAITTEDDFPLYRG